MDRERETTGGNIWQCDELGLEEQTYPRNYRFHEDKEYALIERLNGVEAIWVVGHADPINENDDGGRVLIVLDGMVVQVNPTEIVQ